MKAFILWMMLASALGFIKLLALAYVMQVEEYGQYIAYFSVAALSATIMSAGLIERTIKSYPREWINGNQNLIIIDAINIALMITRRFIILGLIGYLLSFCQYVPVENNIIVTTIGLGLCASYIALLASLYRAAGSQKELQKFTLWRSITALLVVLSAGYIQGWQGALAGELAANLIAVMLGVKRIEILFNKVQLTFKNILAVTKINDNSQSDLGHYHLYFANLAILIVTMVDKPWLSVAAGPAIAGTYGVVMLIPQIAQLVVNIIMQHTGPLIIKLAHLKQENEKKINKIRLQAGLISMLSFLLVCGGLVAKRVPYLDHLFEKFAISDLSIFFAGLVAAGQMYYIIEFHLIARNCEKYILKASVASAVVFIMLFGILAINNAGIEWFIGAMALSRWTQVLILRSAYLRYV